MKIIMIFIMAFMIYIFKNDFDRILIRIYYLMNEYFMK